jgi:putative two-component system response regulator
MLHKEHPMTAKLSVLIVDDNRTNLALMDMLVRKLPDCTTQLQSDPQAVLSNLSGLNFDLAVIACRMAHADGIDLARRIKAEPRLQDRPVLLAADEPDAEVRARARGAGIAEVLGKPINPVELRARIVSLTRPAGLPPATSLEPRGHLPGDTPDMTAHEVELLSMLVKVAGYRDRETPMHSLRMARYCAILAHNLGLPEEYRRDILHAAPLHDIGKAGLSDALLRKPGFLTPEERREMEEHTRLGHDMMRGMRSNTFRMAAEIALSHHERWDGSGYPQRLKGEQIPLAARIAAVADVFDALTSVRAYKTAWSAANAFTYLHDNAGEQFDPACVAAFAGARDEIVEVMRAMPDPDDGTADAA